MDKEDLLVHQDKMDGKVQWDRKATEVAKVSKDHQDILVVTDTTAGMEIQVSVLGWDMCIAWIIWQSA